VTGTPAAPSAAPPATPHDGPAFGRPGLHPGLSAMLQRAHADEVAARGAQRRPAFRLVRELLGACLTLGIPVDLLADCLGITQSSLRTRISRNDGLLTGAQVLHLTGHSPESLAAAAGMPLPRQDGLVLATAMYRTADVVRAVLASEPVVPADHRLQISEPEPS
jgi:hypothetical protein